MMNRIEYILGIVAEECGETAQRAIKAQRFGLNECQPGQDENNAQRLLHEFHDIIGTMELLAEETRHPNLHPLFDDKRKAIEQKKDRIRTYMAYSVEQGTLIE